MMSSLTLVVAVAFNLLAAPITVEAQQAGRMPRIGISGSSESPSDRHLWDAFLQGLRDLGYVDGRSVVIQWHPRKGRTWAAVVADMIDLRVDVIIAGNSAVAVAAKQATATIPIVMMSADPIASGLVSNLARPGGNVTGVSLLSTDVVGKQVQLLREAIPRIEGVFRISMARSRQ